MKQKMKQLIDVNINMNEDVKFVIEYLKTFDFETTYQLREILKLSKLGKYYKDIYRLFYQVKGVKLFPLSDNEIEDIIKFFTEFENNHHDNISRNLSGYDIFIYITLREMGHDCYRHIVLSNNYKKKVKMIMKKY
jgi:hypothetical protein